MTLVSIIIPYNIDRGYLDEAIRSVDNQTHKSVELILSKSDSSVAININNGIRRAHGEFIRFCSEDNILTPNCIEDSINGIKGFDFIHGNAINFSEDNQYLQTPRLLNPSLKQMVIKNVLHGGTVMYRAECFEIAGVMDESLLFAEEYDLNMRFLAFGLRLGYVDSILQRYRLHDNQKSYIRSSNRALKLEAVKKIQNRYV